MFKIWTEKQKDRTIFFMQHNDEIRNISFEKEYFEKSSKEEIIDFLITAFQKMIESLFACEVSYTVKDAIKEAVKEAVQEECI